MCIIIGGRKYQIQTKLKGNCSWSQTQTISHNNIIIMESFDMMFKPKKKKETFGAILA